MERTFCISENVQATRPAKAETLHAIRVQSLSFRLTPRWDPVASRSADPWLE